MAAIADPVCRGSDFDAYGMIPKVAPSFTQSFLSDQTRVVINPLHKVTAMATCSTDRRRTRRRLVLSMIVGCALVMMLAGPELLTTVEARNGSVSSRQASPSSTRRPRSGAIRTQRAAPKRPTSAASANIAARVQRAASPRQAQSAQRDARSSITRPRSASGRTTGRSTQANTRRNSVQSLTGGYRPADPAPLRNGAGNTPGSGAAGNRGSVGSNGSLGTRVNSLSRQVNELRESVRLVEANAYHSGWMAGQAFTRSLVNEARINSRP